MLVVPVAGHDSMLLNLSGAHAPLFTRNLVVLKDSIGNTGGSNEAQTTQNPFNFGQDRGNNAFDVRHSMNASVLYQLPGNFLIDLRRLEHFFRAIRATVKSRAASRAKHVMEFRHPSWYVSETYAKLASMTHYALLQVPRDADAKEIRRAYFRLVSVVHPDKFYGRLPALAAENCGIREVYSDDDNLEAVFQYLVSK